MAPCKHAWEPKKQKRLHRCDSQSPKDTASIIMNADNLAHTSHQKVGISSPASCSRCSSSKIGVSRHAAQLKKNRLLHLPAVVAGPHLHSMHAQPSDDTLERKAVCRHNKRRANPQSQCFIFWYRQKFQISPASLRRIYARKMLLLQPPSCTASHGNKGM